MKYPWTQLKCMLTHMYTHSRGGSGGSGSIHDGLLEMNNTIADRRLRSNHFTICSICIDTKYCGRYTVCLRTEQTKFVEVEKPIYQGYTYSTRTSKKKTYTREKQYRKTGNNPTKPNCRAQQQNVGIEITARRKWSLSCVAFMYFILFSLFSACLNGRRRRRQLETKQQRWPRGRRG